MNTSYISDPILNRDQQSLSGEKRPRQVSTSTPEPSISRSDCGVNKKKKHARQEKKRRVDLNTCYGELMAILIRVDPEMGGSLEGTDQNKSNVPEIVSVKNLLPRRDLINRAVVIMNMIQEENEQLEKIVKQRRNIKFVEVLRKNEKTLRRSQPRLASGVNDESQCINRREGYAQNPHQASMNSNFEQMPNLTIQRNERVEGLRFGTYNVPGRVQFNGNTEQTPQMNNLKQQMNEEALTVYSDFLHRLVTNQN